MPIGISSCISLIDVSMNNQWFQILGCRQWFARCIDYNKGFFSVLTVAHIIIHKGKLCSEEFSKLITPFGCLIPKYGFHLFQCPQHTLDTCIVLVIVEKPLCAFDILYILYILLVIRFFDKEMAN